MHTVLLDANTMDHGEDSLQTEMKQTEQFTLRKKALIQLDARQRELLQLTRFRD